MLGCHELGSSSSMVENRLPVKHVVDSCVSGCSVEYYHEIGMALNGLGSYGPPEVG